MGTRYLAQIKLKTHICSDSLSLEELLCEKDCVAFTFKTLQNFVGDDGCLQFRLLISCK